MEYLRKCREAKGFTREHVARSSGMSLSKYSKLERSEIDNFKCSYISMLSLYYLVADDGESFISFMSSLQLDYVSKLMQ